ncbi:Rieske (2Fe-2S) protein [Acinetobacter tianfuensis]|uniref:(2Fe-2S)-binding protein n=1 Tax=Acinetobacter tianfuensis TaxID=2419603 RepID=A0A3A8EAU6_9GAMM|nr:Rieske 2Fe-2S domain-containing protein [Acinetobacter tianfuensis]RKG30636.1 (2Fe-2S)-binding protein [Acinetobacter tianfuensis]
MNNRFEVPSEKIPSLGQRVFLKAGEQSIILFNIDNQLYAIEDSCPHQGASLYGGKLDGCTIKCPAHGLRFNLADGFMVNSELLKLNAYCLEEINGRIYIVLKQEVQ